jgi:hypothetical protein
MIVAAAIGRARRKITAHFLMHHAISREDAVAYVPDRHIVRRQFEQMVRKGIVHDAGQGRYWLDLPAYEAAHKRQHRILLIAVFIAALVIAGAAVLAYQKGLG